MARIVFSISLALVALSAVISAAPVSTRCVQGDCNEVPVAYEPEACDYGNGDSDLEDEYTKRHFDADEYCMTPDEYDTVLRWCDDGDHDDLDDFYDQCYGGDLDDALTKRHHGFGFNSHSNLPPRCFPFGYSDRFHEMLAHHHGDDDEFTKRHDIPLDGQGRGDGPQGNGGEPEDEDPLHDYYDEHH